MGKEEYGIEYIVLNEGNKNIYVLKRNFLKGTNNEKSLRIKNEANILSSTKSDKIVKYYDFFEDNESFNIIL